MLGEASPLKLLLSSLIWGFGDSKGHKLKRKEDSRSGVTQQHNKLHSNGPVLSITVHKQLVRICLRVNVPLTKDTCNIDWQVRGGDYWFGVMCTARYSPFRLYPPSRGGSQERAYLFLRPTVHTVFSNAPTFRGQLRLSGFGCVLDHSATTFGACAHSMKTAVRYQLRTQGRFPLQILPPNPSTVEGARGDLSSSVQTIGLEGDTRDAGLPPRLGG